MNVRHLVAVRTQQAQDKVSNFVSNIGPVNEAKAAMTRARDEGRKLLATLGRLPTVTTMRSGVQARLAAVRGFGDTARADAVTAAAELRATAKRVLARPRPQPVEATPEPASDRQALAH